jgi:hypothetical protein
MEYLTSFFIFNLKEDIVYHFSYKVRSFPWCLEFPRLSNYCWRIQLIYSIPYTICLTWSPKIVILLLPLLSRFYVVSSNIMNKILNKIECLLFLFIYGQKTKSQVDWLSDFPSEHLKVSRKSGLAVWRYTHSSCKKLYVFVPSILLSFNEALYSL